jgi:hypothetical protein
MFLKPKKSFNELTLEQGNAFDFSPKINYLDATEQTGVNLIKLFMSVIYEIRNKLECLSLTSLFQPSTMFAGKPGA